MIRKLLVRTLALVLVACIMLPLFAVAESYSAKVYSSSMKVYSKASTSGSVLGTLKSGEKFTVTQTSGSWAKIKYNNKEGWAQIKDMIKLKHDTLRYTTKTVNVYKTAGKTKINQLSVDYPLYVVGMSGNYYLVDDYNGKFTGYVSKSALSEKKTDPYSVSSSKKKSYSSEGSRTSVPSAVKSTQTYVASSQGTTALRKYIAYIAENKSGCKYVSSGANNKDTFSNYSFVSSCFKAIGYSIPSSIKSVANIAKSKQIDRSHLLIGDIVCLNVDTADNMPVDHIGIYIGSGYFIHASAKAGCVVISSLNSKYYKNAFCYGRRVIGA